MITSEFLAARCCRLKSMLDLDFGLFQSLTPMEPGSAALRSPPQGHAPDFSRCPTIHKKPWDSDVTFNR